MSPLLVIGVVLSVIFYGVILVGGVLFVRRTWNQIRAEGDGSVHMRLLDEVQRLQFQVEMTNERLGRMEGKLDALPPGEGPSHDEDADRI